MKLIFDESDYISIEQLENEEFIGVLEETECTSGRYFIVFNKERYYYLISKTNVVDYTNNLRDLLKNIQGLEVYIFDTFEDLMNWVIYDV